MSHTLGNACLSCAREFTKSARFYRRTEQQVRAWGHPERAAHYRIKARQALKQARWWKQWGEEEIARATMEIGNATQA
jgi:hypothetical protein